MVFIADMIKKAKDEGGLAAGQAKYYAYFGFKPTLYAKVKDATDEILISYNCEDCIVEKYAYEESLKQGE